MNKNFTNYKKDNRDKAEFSYLTNKTVDGDTTQENEDVSKRNRDENLSNRNDKNSKYQD